jgi:hypothetical protein
MKAIIKPVCILMMGRKIVDFEPCLKNSHNPMTMQFLDITKFKDFTWITVTWSGKTTKCVSLSGTSTKADLTLTIHDSFSLSTISTLG